MLLNGNIVNLLPVNFTFFPMVFWGDFCDLGISVPWTIVLVALPGEFRMFRKSKGFFLIAITLGLLFSINANAETIVGICYEPNGQRIDFIDGKFEEDKDGYSNSNPTFVFSSDKPNVLIENWQAANPWPDVLTREEVDALSPPTATESDVIFRSEEVIHAVSTGGRDAYTTTLYLLKGIGIFTRVQIMPDMPGNKGLWPLPPMGAVYKAKCNFKHIQ